MRFITDLNAISIIALTSFIQVSYAQFLIEESPLKIFLEQPPTFSFHKYEDVKDKIKFPKYSPEMRQYVANEVEKMFDVYVNRESKIENYGSWVDPIPRIENVVANAANMTDQQFHTELATIFLNLRDFHTNYILPQPYSCHVAIWPLFLDLVKSEDIDSRPKAVVRSLPRLKEVREFAPGLEERVHIGDTFVSYNNKTFKELFEDNKWLSGGANNFGGQRSVLNYFTARSGGLFLMPNETEAHYVLRNKNGSLYNVKAPIVIRRNEQCYQDGMFFGSEEGHGHHPSHYTFSPFPEIKRKQHDLAYNPFYDDTKATFKRDTASLSFKTTEEPILSWDIYNRGNRKLGIIRLDSFVPEKLGVMGTVASFRNLLVNELKDTDALLIDVRSNGGGIVTLSDCLPQLFVPDYQPAGSRALVSRINKLIFTSEMFNSSEWGDAYREVKEGDKYTKLVPFTTSEDANSFGQAYLKPVGVFNDGQCYSACDLFSASMQDSGAAFVFGEDPQTGAGGANVVGHNDFFLSVLPEEFNKLPRSQNMRVGWRQLIRNGKNDGKLIEDHGVFADAVVRPIAKDFLPNQTRSSQLDYIAHRLILDGRKTGKSFRTFLTDQDVSFESEVNAPVTFTGSLSWMNKLVLVKDEKEVQSIKVTKSKLPTSFKLADAEPITEYGFFKYTILGYTDSKQVLKTKRSVRTIPKKSDYLSLNADYEWDFEFNKHSIIYNMGSPAEHGWQKTEDQKLRTAIDSEGKYYSNVMSTLSMFIEIPEDREVTLHVEAIYDTEPGYDFFAIIASTENGNAPLAIKTGRGKYKGNLPLSMFAGNSIELVFAFQSDPAEEASGVTINRIGFTSSRNSKKLKQD